MNVRIKIPSDGLYVHLDASTQGPFTRTVIDELFTAGKLSRATPLWYYGLSGWITVGDVPEFDRRAHIGPPPLPKNIQVTDLIVSVAGAAQNKTPLEVQRMIANHDLRRADYVFHQATQEWIRMDQHPQTRRFFNDPNVPVVQTTFEGGARAVVPSRRQSTSRRTFAVGFSMVGLFTVLSAGAYYYWTLSPKYALWQVAKAWQRKDWDKMTRFVEVQEVMSNAVNALVASEDAKPNNDPYAISWKEQLSNAFGDKFKSAMVAFLSGAVEGYFKASNLEQNAVIPIPGLNGALSAFDPKKMGIQAQGLNDLEINGNKAKLYVGFHHKKFRKDFEVEVLFEKRQRWKIVAIDNIVELLKDFEEWEAQPPPNPEVDRPITDRRSQIDAPLGRSQIDSPLPSAQSTK